MPCHNFRPGFAENHEIIIRRLSAISGMEAVGAISVDRPSRYPLGVDHGVDRNMGSGFREWVPF